MKTDVIVCPACEQEQDLAVCFLGQLGTRVHCRCRFCGMMFSHAENEMAGENLRDDREDDDRDNSK